MGKIAEMRIGVVSDTHDTFDPALTRLFEGIRYGAHAAGPREQQLARSRTRCGPSGAPTCRATPSEAAPIA